MSARDIISRQASESGYRLDQSVLRQEVAAMAVKLKGLDLSDEYVCQNIFLDVNSAQPNTWACRVIELAASNDISSIDAELFRPEVETTRAEALAMLMGGICLDLDMIDISGITFSDDTADWQKRIIAAANLYGISSHTTTFKPNNSATRGEIFVFATNLHKLSEQKDFCGEIETKQVVSSTWYMSGETKIFD